MLAGCKDNSSSSSEGDGTVVTPVSGVAASINAELDDNKDVIEFTDNTKIQNLLETYFADNDLSVKIANSEDITISYNGSDGSLGNLVANYVKVTNSDYVITELIANGYDGTDKADKDILNVFVLNSKKLTKEAALKLVGQYLDDANLPKMSNDTTCDYEYTGSVAMVEAKTENDAKGAWVIAVTVEMECFE